MPISAPPAQRSRNRTHRCTPYWREFLFWLLLIPASAALSSGKLTRQLIGFVETCAFLVVAISSAGRLKSLGLEFIAWEKIPRSAIFSSSVIGFAAGLAILGIARLTRQPIGTEPGWNMAVLAVIIGPVLEEIIFRGYLLTFALWLTRRVSRHLASTLSIGCVAALFAAAHVGKTGVTVIQFVCIVFTGCIYGWLRFQYDSIIGAAVAHAIYNCALYLGNRYTT